MSWTSPHAHKTTLISLCLLWVSAAAAQASPAGSNPPEPLENAVVAEAAAPLPSVEAPASAAWASLHQPTRAQVAQDFTARYLDLWSAPNRVALASASSFYSPTVTFHGRLRSRGSVLAEKRQFVQRWPDRIYRYRPGTTQVTCEGSGTRCTVRSIFDYTAANAAQGRRSRGTGNHELVVSFAGGRPVIAAENSRVVRRGPARL
jgi:hypothetical protein